MVVGAIVDGCGCLRGSVDGGVQSEWRWCEGGRGGTELPGGTGDDVASGGVKSGQADCTGF